eukprot:2917731-Rhodomonas_salina.1
MHPRSVHPVWSPQKENAELRERMLKEGEAATQRSAAAAAEKDAAAASELSGSSYCPMQSSCGNCKLQWLIAKRVSYAGLKLVVLGTSREGEGEGEGEGAEGEWGGEGEERTRDEEPERAQQRVRTREEMR